MEKFRNSAPKEGETPRLSKYKQRMLDQKKGQTKVIDENRRILIQFSDPDGNSVEQKYDLALGTTQEDLQVLMNQILENKSSEEYTFYHKHVEIRKSLGEFAVELGELDPEKVLEVTYHPQEMFHVRPITRISSSLAGKPKNFPQTQF
jgi:ribosome assembly protein 4